VHLLQSPLNTSRIAFPIPQKINNSRFYNTCYIPRGRRIVPNTSFYY
jgi:hypothetical protein